MEWQPIETAPKTAEEFDAVYGDDPLRPRTVIIGRADCPVENGVMPGCVCDAYLRDGVWQKPAHPDWRHFSGDWIVIAAPTHWMPLPPPPTNSTPTEGTQK